MMRWLAIFILICVAIGQSDDLYQSNRKIADLRKEMVLASCHLKHSTRLMILARKFDQNELLFVEFKTAWHAELTMFIERCNERPA